MKTKVIEINENYIIFDNGMNLSSDHDSDCCEHHWVEFKSVNLKDFEGLEFNLEDDNFFERIKDYGIALKPIFGHPIRIPGYGSNNGYYSDNLSLTLSNGTTVIKSFDISECQYVND